METLPTPDETPNEATEVEVIEVIEASVEPSGLGEIQEVDITENLTDDQIRDLFAAFNDEDWDEVDRLIEGFDANGVYTDSKAGGADRNRGQAEKLRKYWTVGAGGQKIRWGTSGDFTRCVSLVGKHLGPRAKGYCALRHKEMNGYYPGDKRNKSDSPDLEASDPAYHEAKEDAETMLEHKVVSLKGMNVVDADKGIVETIISVTGIVDNVKDRILPGAYSKTLAKRKPKGVWSHDWDTPVSKTLDVKELMPGDPELPKTMPDGDPWPSNAGALKVKTQFNLDTQRGREAYSDVVFFADEQEWSIGYNVPVGGAKVDTKSGVREIETLELYEYSPVLFGAMPLARTTSVKEAQLAMKALKGGAASWLSEVPAEEVEAAGPDAEEKDAAEEMGDYELPADQMVLVKRAISTLTDLLSVVQGAEFKAEEMDEAEEEATEPEDSPEEEAAEEPAEDEVTEYDSLSSAVEDMITDADLKSAMLEAAGPVDDAIESDDADAMDSSTSAFLDVVEKALKDGKEEGTLKEVAAMMADLIQSVVGEAPSEEIQEEKAEPAEGNVILNTDEITSLLDSLK